MSKLLISFLFSLTLFSCKSKTDTKDILSEAKMRTVLWDIMRADEWVNYEYLKDSSTNRYQRSIVLYQKVFQVNKITADQFKKSFLYYQSHPELLKPILDSIKQNGPAFANPIKGRRHPLRDASL